jgi:hypothetical protein
VFCSDSCAGKTAVNHNRCLHLTATEFLGRVRAAQAQQEDFDAVIEEFGIGCPCKTPPLKSKGKQHLGTTAHKKAFLEVGGPFYGMTVRQALERAQSSNVILVAGSAAIQGNGPDVDDAQQQAAAGNEAEEYEMLNADPYCNNEGDLYAQQADVLDDDVSDIIAED